MSVVGQRYFGNRLAISVTQRVSEKFAATFSLAYASGYLGRQGCAVQVESPRITLHPLDSR